MNRIIILLILLIYIFFSSSSGVFAQDNNTTIKNIQFILTVAKNSEVAVLQKISLENYEGGSLTIDIPRRVNISDNVRFYGIENLKVTLDGTKTIDFEKEEDGENIRLVIDGVEPDKNGNAEFIVSYKVSRGFSEGDLKDDFLIYLVGGKMPYPVRNTQATISAPDLEIVDASCFAGDVEGGQRMCVSEFDPDEARVASTTALGQGKGLAVQFGIRKGGNLEKPSASQLFFGKAVDYLGIYWKPIVISILIVVSVGWFGRKMFYIKRKI